MPGPLTSGIPQLQITGPVELPNIDWAAIGKFFWDPNTPPSWEGGPEPYVPPALQPVRDVMGNIETIGNNTGDTISTVASNVADLASTAANASNDINNASGAIVPAIIVGGLLLAAISLRNSRG